MSLHGRYVSQSHRLSIKENGAQSSSLVIRNIERAIRVPWLWAYTHSWTGAWVRWRNNPCWRAVLSLWDRSRGTGWPSVTSKPIPENCASLSVPLHYQ